MFQTGKVMINDILFLAHFISYSLLKPLLEGIFCQSIRLLEKGIDFARLF